jgi:hypothetical protein
MVGRQVDGHERTEAGLNVGDEEDEPIETAPAAARARRGGGIGGARDRRLGFPEAAQRAGGVFER